MNGKCKTRVEIRNYSKAAESTPAVVDVHEWRILYAKLLLKFPKGKVPYKELGKKDSYYLTREGGLELYKVKQDLASLPKTARAVKALEKWFDTQSDEKVSKRLKRHKLISQ
jgi:hypothetical protein